MVKAGKWFRNILAGKKEKNEEKEVEKMVWLQLPPTPPPPPTTPKEKKRQEMEKYNPKDEFTLFFVPALEQRRHSKAVASVYLPRAASRKSWFEEIAAIKIQSSFRSYLARKALRALKGLVKLQGVVRGFLVRKKAAATLRSLQALLTVQARARAQRIQINEVVHEVPWRDRRKMMSEFKLQRLHDTEKNVEIDIGQSKGSSKGRKSNQITHNETKVHRNFSLNDMGSGTRSARFDDHPSFTASKNNSQFLLASSHKPQRMSYSEELPHLIPHESPLYPNYMANTESWRAKARSQSVPRQIYESFDQKLYDKQREFMA